MGKGKSYKILNKNNTKLSLASYRISIFNENCVLKSLSLGFFLLPAWNLF